jgi:hypothetical protein
VQRLGYLEQAVLEALTPKSGRTVIRSTSEIARHIFGARASNSELASLRRALASLRRKKRIHGGREPGRGENTWRRAKDTHSRQRYEDGLDLTRLAKLLNMLSSDHQGERDTTVRAIERDRKRLGGDWVQILRGMRAWP